MDQSRIISMNARAGSFSPKKIIDHNAFNDNWMMKNLIAFLDFLLVHNKYNEYPINKYKHVQTGPKIQFGGLKLGLTNVAYHVGIEFTVNIEPIAPANWQIRRE